MGRRTFLAGAVGLVTAATLSACTFDAGPTPTTRTPTATPTPTGTPTPVPSPRSMVRSRWSHDPFARGAASFTAVGATDQNRIDLAAPVGDRLFFAGEACSVEQPGTVDGAIASGADAARALRDVAVGGERIAVIGAGASGLTAARALIEAGFTVRVIEARDRAGGRVASRSSDSWPVPVELGPWTIAEGDDAFRQQLDQAGVGYTTFDRIDDVRTSAGATVTASPVGADAVTSAVEWSSGGPHDVTVDRALTASGAGALSTEKDADGVSPADWLAYDLGARVAPRTGASSDRLSAWNGGAAESGDGIGDFIPTDGFSEMVEKLADGIDVLTKSAVTQVSYTDTRVGIRLATGESLTVDRAIVTVPLGVLKGDALSFIPELPLTKARAISILGMGTVDRIWLRYDEPFWSSTATVFSTVGTDAAVARWVNLQPVTGDAVLVGTIAAGHASAIAELGDDAALAAVLPSLEPFLATPAEGTGPGSPTPTPPSST